MSSWGAAVTAGRLDESEMRLLEVVYENMLQHATDWVVYGDVNRTAPVRVEAYDRRFLCSTNSHWGRNLWERRDRERQVISSWNRCFQMKFIYTLIASAKRMSRLDRVVLLEPDLVIRRRDFFAFVERIPPTLNETLVTTFGLPHVLPRAIVRRITGENVIRSISRTMWMANRYHIRFNGPNPHRAFAHCYAQLSKCRFERVGNASGFNRCVQTLQNVSMCGIPRYARPEWPLPIISAHRPMSRNQDWILPPFYRSLGTVRHLDNCAVFWANQYPISMLLAPKSSHPKLSLTNWIAQLGRKAHFQHRSDQCGSKWLIYHHAKATQARSLMAHIDA